MALQSLAAGVGAAERDGEELRPILLYEIYADETDHGKRYFSPFCWAIRLALKHKGIPYDTVPWRFLEGSKIAFTGQGKVPVIVDENQGGKWVNDSWAIAQYLEATYPGHPSLFGGPAGEAGSAFIQKWVMGTLARPMLKLYVLDMHDKHPEAQQRHIRHAREAQFGMTLEEYAANGSNRGQVVAEFQAALEPLRATLREFPWLGGSEGPDYADMYVMGFFVWAFTMSAVRLLEECDPIHDWRKRMFSAYNGLAATAIGYPDSL